MMLNPSGRLMMTSKRGNTPQRTPEARFKSLGKIKAALEQLVWVGTHSKGELPNF
jgi:hypothetical protein